MSDYPFNLLGHQILKSGSGRKDGEAVKSLKFTLTQGIVIAEIRHHGHGDFKLKFVPAEGLSEGQATAASLGGAVAAGAAIGSVVPVAGTILGGLLGAGAGWLAGSAIKGAIGPTIWTPVEHKGEIDTCNIVRVKEDEKDCLPPGKYRLEVESKAKWTCRFIQPNLGQSFGPLVADDGETHDDDMHAGLYIIGPLTSGTRPLIANIRHKGGGGFYVAAYSVDGTHQCILYEQEGQFHVEDVRTELKPGKEYMLYTIADGNWNLRFTEGY